MKNFIQIPLLLFLITCSVLLNGQVVDSAQGSISPSGKFIPADIQNEKFNAVSHEEVLKNFQNSIGFSQLDTHLFKINEVVFNSEERWIEFPSVTEKIDPTVNIEYVVGSYAEKGHESIFVTKVNPIDIHFAALLLHISPTTWVPEPQLLDSFPLKNEVTVEARFKRHRGLEICNINDILSIDMGVDSVRASRGEGIFPAPPKPFPKGRWFYSGSQFMGSRFCAQREGGYIATIYDPSALINYGEDLGPIPLKIICNPKSLPQKGHPVTIRITLPPNAPSK